MKHAFVVINPVAGNVQQPAMDRVIQDRLGKGQIEPTVFITKGDPTDREHIKRAVGKGYDLFIAVGGDGTVSSVADALTNTQIPMGILPMGTGNGVARALQVPLNVYDALGLIFGDHRLAAIDAMRISDRTYLLAVGAGVSATALRYMDVQMKRRIGRLHYLLIGAKAFIGFQPREFNIVVDEVHKSVHGSEALVLNCPALGDPYIRWGEGVQIDDGMLDVYVMRARTALDFLVLAWSALRGRERSAPQVLYLQARERIRIATNAPVPVQGDGDLLGETPLEIDLLPRAVRVMVPMQYKDEPPGERPSGSSD